MGVPRTGLAAVLHFLVCLCVIHCAVGMGAAANNSADADDSGAVGTVAGMDTGDTWAVIVSSSRYWLNYRHSANALAVYQAVRRWYASETYGEWWLPTYCLHQWAAASSCRVACTSLGWRARAVGRAEHKGNLPCVNLTGGTPNELPTFQPLLKPPPFSSSCSPSTTIHSSLPSHLLQVGPA